MYLIYNKIIVEFNGQFLITCTFERERHYGSYETCTRFVRWNEQKRLYASLYLQVYLI